ncbi:MAG: hypothetical protein IPP68_12425 [Elusimicrobia bacterium]|nr:hypothetical protein [Elusimicrobiota bacterium]
MTLFAPLTPAASPPLPGLMSLPVTLRLLSAVPLPVAPVIVTSPSVPPVRVKAPAPSMVWLKLIAAPAAAAGVGAVDRQVARVGSTAPVTVTVGAGGDGGQGRPHRRPLASALVAAPVRLSWFWLYPVSGSSPHPVRRRRPR